MDLIIINSNIKFKIKYLIDTLVFIEVLIEETRITD